MKIKYYGYNAFVIEHAGLKLVIDPGKDLWILNLDSLVPRKEWQQVSHILTTHADPDHFAYAVKMAKESNAKVFCAEALIDDFQSENVNNVFSIKVDSRVEQENITVEGLITEHGTLPVDLLGGLIQMTNEVIKDNQAGKKIFLGPLKVFESKENIPAYSRGTINILFGLITLVKENIDFARGSIGFKIKLGDRTIVNLGDTLLKQEWKGLKPDVLMLPIGGAAAHNTMDEKEALEAVKLIEPKAVIPCHYNCDFLWRKNANPADDKMFKAEVEKLGIACHLMKPADELNLN
ncbi:MAG: MBL fold metallo-hydrolase [Gammaproteobacteria bacterium]|nr:MBL fold metallo-hydrolase [Gammaproteobacteria bacterium]MCW8986541.1 MBL fold metallo-hydrolase [Gammaproteobacteria bacterium]MCW9030756.1 MBL fold metallo-hydrolase [Gammaproteobacteria bacterium]